MYGSPARQVRRNPATAATAAAPPAAPGMDELPATAARITVLPLRPAVLRRAVAPVVPMTAAARVLGPTLVDAQTAHSVRSSSPSARPGVDRRGHYRVYGCVLSRVGFGRTGKQTFDLHPSPWPGRSQSVKCQAPASQVSQVPGTSQPATPSVLRPSTTSPLHRPHEHCNG